MKLNYPGSVLFSILKKALIILSVMLIILIVAKELGILKKDDGVKEEISDDKQDVRPIPVQEKIIVPKVIYNLSGRITKIDGNTIVFGAEMYDVGEKGDRSVREEERMAIVNPQTKISILSFVDRSPVDKKINFSDLKTGYYVEIISSSDISGAEEFVAAQIRVKQAL